LLQGGQSYLRDAVLQQFSQLQQELASSDVLELPAGVPYLLRTSAVLLKGTLKVSGRPYVEGKKGLLPIYFSSFEFSYCGLLKPPIKC
jgi:hypothetical protein